MLTYTLENDIATIALDDGKANVFSTAMSKELKSALSQAGQEAKVTILKGRNDQFSAGYDLKIMMSEEVEAKAEMVIEGFDLICQTAAHPTPLIAACAGNAFGLGAFLLLTSDTRIGVDGDYKICLPETRAGMVFTPLLVAAAKDRIAKSKYVEAVLQSMPYRAKDSVSVGFLDRVVPSEQFDAVIEKAAALLSEYPKKIYAKNKLDLNAEKLKIMNNDLAAIKANPKALADSWR